MAAETQLEDLLLRWEELQHQGETIVLEDLCRGCPELLEPLRSKVQALKAMGQVLRGTEPAAQSSQAETGTATPIVHLADLRPGLEPVPGYTLERQLGRGGFGEVWKAAGPGGFSVALKFASLDGRTGTLELRALEIVKGLRHPHLLAMFGAWQREDVLVVAMELADETLHDCLTKARAQNLPGIPGENLFRYVGEAAEGLDFLNSRHHRFGDQEDVAILHRDIKPQNLFLVGGGVKVADFGLVRLLERSVAAHTGSMTMAYAAPEYFEGKSAQSSDQYSLAVTYCQLRGGRLPFSGTAAQIMEGHLRRPPDLTMVPESERPALARALAKNPGERWPSCKEFAVNLSGMQASSPSKSLTSGTPAGVAQVPSALGPSSKKARRRRKKSRQPFPQLPLITVSLLAALSMVLAVAASLYFFWKRSDKNLAKNMTSAFASTPNDTRNRLIGPLDSKVSSTPIGSSSKTAAGAGVDSRVKWVHPTGGYFYQMADGRWEEIGSTQKHQFFWREIRRTPEYVELLEETRNIGIRLYSDRAEICINTQWGPYLGGRWVPAR